MAKIQNLTIETINFNTNSVTGTVISTSSVLVPNPAALPVQLSFYGYLTYTFPMSSGYAATWTGTVTRTRGSLSFYTYSHSDQSGLEYGGPGWVKWQGDILDVDAAAGDTYTFTISENTSAGYGTIVSRQIYASYAKK